MTVADVRVRASRRNGSGDGPVAALNGSPINGSEWNPPGSSNDWIHELSLAGESSPTQDHPKQDVAPAWPPAALDSWPVAPDELEMERSRLEAEIAAAKARAMAARHRDAERRAALHAEVVASQQILAQMEAQHDKTVATIRQAAQAEVARILSRARQQVVGRNGGATDSDGTVNHAG